MRAQDRQRIERFLRQLEELCREHGVSLIGGRYESVCIEPESPPKDCHLKISYESEDWATVDWNQAAAGTADPTTNRSRGKPSS